MRHLIDTYIEADQPRKISPFDNMGLLDLIVKTGIASAIASQLAPIDPYGDTRHQGSGQRCSAGALVSGPDQGEDRGADREMGADPWRQGEAAVCPAYENQVGQL